MPIRAASANRSFTRAAPSSMEYSVWTCRCTNESTTGSCCLLSRATDRPGDRLAAGGDRRGGRRPGRAGRNVFLSTRASPTAEGDSPIRPARAASPGLVAAGDDGLLLRQQRGELVVGHQPAGPAGVHGPDLAYVQQVEQQPQAGAYDGRVDARARPAQDPLLVLVEVRVLLALRLLRRVVVDGGGEAQQLVRLVPADRGEPDELLAAVADHVLDGGGVPRGLRQRQRRAVEDPPYLQRAEDGAHPRGRLVR